jgi:hypothetical protein
MAKKSKNQGRETDIVRHIIYDLSRSPLQRPCYTYPMTKLLEEVVAKLRTMPDVVQDLAAMRLLRHAEEASRLAETDATAEGRRGFQRGDVGGLERWPQDIDFHEGDGSDDESQQA